MRRVLRCQECAKEQMKILLVRQEQDASFRHRNSIEQLF